MERSVRAPVVAGSFYPADPNELREMVAGFLGGAPGSVAGVRAGSSVAAIVPHAGFVYSGGVAGAGFRAAAAFGRPDLVLLLGASHTGAGDALSLPVEAAWRTPLGDVALDAAAIERAHGLGLRGEPAAFRREHSMEVVLPFLQVLFADVPPVMPVCVRLAPWDALEVGAGALRDLIGTRRAWIVASSDFTHYESDRVARSIDRAALERILRRDAEGFYREVIERGLSICGAAAICVLLLLARDLGLARSELVSYTTSGDVTGDRDAVVGYAAALFSKETL